MNNFSVVTDPTAQVEAGVTKRSFACVILEALLLAVIAGYGWGTFEDFIPLSLLLAAAWSIAPNRFWAGAVAVVYYCTASRGLPIGAATYFEMNLASGVVLWVAGCCLLAIPFALLWSKSSIKKFLAFPLVLVIVSVPPFGVFGWTNPLVTAGVIFPGTGLAGLAITAFLVAVLAWMPRVYMGVGFIVAALFFVPDSESRIPAGWEGVNTSERFETGNADHVKTFLRQQEQVNQVRIAEGEKVLFPESAAGLWTDATAKLWRDNPPIKPVFIGAEVLAGEGLDNALIAIRSEGFEVLYKQRMPVPISMYRPWDERSTNAYWFADPVVDIAGDKAGILICYESLLVWPVLHSAMSADYLVSIGNFWWAKDTSIPAIQSASMKAWAALFNLPLVTASNR